MGFNWLFWLDVQLLFWRSRVKFGHFWSWNLKLSLQNLDLLGKDTDWDHDGNHNNSKCNHESVIVGTCFSRSCFSNWCFLLDFSRKKSWISWNLVVSSHNRLSWVDDDWGLLVISSSNPFSIWNETKLISTSFFAPLSAYFATLVVQELSKHAYFNDISNLQDNILTQFLDNKLSINWGFCDFDVSGSVLDNVFEVHDVVVIWMSITSWKGGWEEYFWSSFLDRFYNNMFSKHGMRPTISYIKVVVQVSFEKFVWNIIILKVNNTSWDI